MSTFFGQRNITQHKIVRNVPRIVPTYIHSGNLHNRSEVSSVLFRRLNDYHERVDRRSYSLLPALLPHKFLLHFMKSQILIIRVGQSRSTSQPPTIVGVLRLIGVVG